MIAEMPCKSGRANDHRAGQLTVYGNADINNGGHSVVAGCGGFGGASR